MLRETAIKIEATVSALVQVATNGIVLLPARLEKHENLLPGAGNSGTSSTVLQTNDTRGGMQIL